MLYYSTFASGFNPIIKKVLVEKGCDIKHLFDGAVCYTPPPHSKHNWMRSHEQILFNNTFRVFSMQKISTIENLMRDVLKSNIKFLRQNGEFRIVTSKENQLCSVNDNLKKQTERLIAKSTGLRLSRRGGGKEFWFLKRREGFSFFMQRLTYHGSKEKFLKKGELAPELAWLLCYMSEPKEGEMFLDPFAGSGAIPNARNKFFKNAKIFALDVKPQQNSVIKIVKADFLSMNLQKNLIKLLQAHHGDCMAKV